MRDRVKKLIKHKHFFKTQSPNGEKHKACNSGSFVSSFPDICLVGSLAKHQLITCKYAPSCSGHFANIFQSKSLNTACIWKHLCVD